MRWIYILECEDNHYYVGETRKLYSRFWQHENGSGSVNTSIYPVINIIAIYPLNKIGRFIEYNEKVNNNDYSLNYNIYFKRGRELYENFNNYNNDNEDEYGFCQYWVENNIVEKMMHIHKENWKNIRGGKYTRFDVDYKYPNNKNIEDLPSCKCGLPCDIRKDEKKNYLYFRCPKKNMWDDIKDLFDIEEEPCDFFMRYNKDKYYKKKYENKKNEIKLLTNKSYWLKSLVGCQYQYCVGGCGKDYDSDNTIRYSGKAINLCFDCFINKNTELKKKYSVYEISDECMILSSSDDD